jgi:hypothetical protein
MTKRKVLGASLAMALLIASPAAADTTVQFGGASVENQFLGTDSVQFGGASVEDEFLFFGDDDLNNAFFD